MCFSVAVFVLVFITIGAYKYYRGYFGYLFFLIKLAVVGYDEKQDTRKHTDFDIDVNVICTDNEKEWIQDHLRPFLAEELPHFQRIAIGDEALRLGMHYLDAVDSLIVDSFKTILLLSRAAVLDNWFLIKFRMAMDHSNDIKMESTVVIFLEDIPDKELPFQVRVYMRDRRPCLQWPEDAEEQEYFWNQLLKRLTVNLLFDPTIPPE